MKVGRQNIVGQRITNIYQTPWVTLDRVDVCRVFVSLDNGLTFEIVCEDTDESRQLDSCEIEADWVLMEHAFGCFGEEIVEVLASDYWPSIGLQLSSGLLLFISDEGPFRVGLQCERLGEKYGEDDVRPYWQ